MRLALPNSSAGRKQFLTIRAPPPLHNQTWVVPNPITTCAGYTGYRPPDAPAGGKGGSPEMLSAPVTAAAAGTALTLPLPAATGADAAAIEQQRREEQAKAVALLEQQMLAIEEQQKALRAELSRLKK